MRFTLALLLSALGATFLTSCASVSVRNVASDANTARPTHFHVVPFTVDPAGVKENPARKNPGQLGREAQLLLANYVAHELNQLGTPAAVFQGGKHLPGSWIVSGRITRLAEGNRLLRMAVGLGAGGTKMETQVDVRNASTRKQVLHFSTTGGSNATPGGVTNPIPFSGVPTALLNSKEGVTDDSARTARMIARTIAQAMVQRGWLAPGKVPPPKVARN